MLLRDYLKLWKIINFSPPHFINLNDDDANPVPESICADIFNSAFASVFPCDSPLRPATSQRYNCPSMPDIIISPCGVANVIEIVKLPSCTGPDDNNSNVVKMTKRIFRHFLCEIFTRFLSYGILPQDCRMESVNPISKRITNQLRFLPSNFTQ